MALTTSVNLYGRVLVLQERVLWYAGMMVENAEVSALAYAAVSGELPWDDEDLSSRWSLRIILYVVPIIGYRLEMRRASICELWLRLL